MRDPPTWLFYKCPLPFLLSDKHTYRLTWELVSVTRSNARVTAAGVGSSLEARVAFEKARIITSYVTVTAVYFEN